MKRTFLLLSLAVIITGFILGMGGNMGKSTSSSLPTGVLYFSNRASIEKIDLKTRKRKEIIPWLDREGKYNSNSIFPVYFSKGNKMYFFRSYVWPVKYQLVTFDLETQKEEEIQELDHYIETLSLSPDEQWFAYFQGGGGLVDPEGQSMEQKPIQLIVRDLMGGKENVVADDVSFHYVQVPVWVSNGELLYRNRSEHIIRVNIHNKEKRDMGFKELEPCTVSPDGKKVIMIERRGIDGSKIYLFDLEQGKLELVKRFSYFSVGRDFIWSPDGKSLVYTHQSWSNLIPFQEVGNLYWYDLAAKREIKLADTVSLFGGFWLPEDPALKNGSGKGA